MLKAIIYSFIYSQPFDFDASLERKTLYIVHVMPVNILLECET